MNKIAYLSSVIALSVSFGTSLAQERTNDLNQTRGAELIQGPSKVTIDEHVNWAKSLVSQQLKDPESAKFRNVFYAVSDSYPSTPYVCGEVNARNSYGGYAGYSWFSISGTKWNREVDKKRITDFIDSQSEKTAASICRLLTPYYQID